MVQARRKALIELGMWIDLAICGLSLIVSSAIVYRPLWATDALLLKHPLPQMFLTLGLGFAWHQSLLLVGAYDSYRIDGLWRQAKALLRGSSFAAAWSLVWLYLSKGKNETSLNLLVLEISIFWILASASLLISRIAARVIMNFLRRRGRNLRNVLIVGSNRRAVSIAESLMTNAGMGYHVVGFVDELWHFQDAPESYKDKLVGSSTDIVKVLRELVLDEVIITLPMASSYHLTRQIIGLCRQQGILVRCDNSLFDSPKWHSQDDDLPSRLITLHDDNRDAVQMMGKRLLDVVLSSAALILTLPILACIALAVKLTSPGPVLFMQERLGLGKRRFRILKFRTMVINAEALMKDVEHLNETEGPTFKLKHDPRVTPIGKFLRKTSLDELPQLFNVLIGDMSLVGPRPLPLRDYRGFSEDWHRRRFSVKPGITCLWQVSGRSFISFERWMELDMDYIDTWSLWLDFKILAKTVPAVMKGSGAV
jgi:exopolysaccharide biosynthesis polyprenyl glycosylphosphotransferase